MWDNRYKKLQFLAECKHNDNVRVTELMEKGHITQSEGKVIHQRILNYYNADISIGDIRYAINKGSKCGGQISEDDNGVTK